MMWPWKRRTFVWSPWMSPAEIDAVNGLEPPPVEVPANECPWHPDGQYHGACVNCLELEGPQTVPPLVVGEAGEGLLW